MTTVLMSLWDVVGYNHIVSSENDINKLTVWLWSIGFNSNCSLRYWDWGNNTGAYEVRCIDPKTGLGGTVCLLAPSQKRVKGLGRKKAQLKQWFRKFPQEISQTNVDGSEGRTWETWQEYVNHFYTEWMKDPH